VAAGAVQAEVVGGGAALDDLARAVVDRDLGDDAVAAEADGGTAQLVGAGAGLGVVAVDEGPPATFLKPGAVMKTSSAQMPSGGVTL
jgi:hypothetical protein